MHSKTGYLVPPEPHDKLYILMQYCYTDYHVLTPIFFILIHRASLSTESNSFSESIKHHYIQHLMVHTCFNYTDITTLSSSSCNRYRLNSSQSLTIQ